MQFSVDKSTLASKLSDVVSVLGVRQTIPSLNGVIFEITDQGVLRLRSSNGDVQLLELLELEKFQPGAILLPGKQLLSIVQSAPNGPLVFIEDETRVHVKAQQVTFKITKMAYDQFPPFPNHPPSIGQIAGIDLREALESVLVSVVKGEEHPVLGGVNFCFEGENLTLYSTDRYRVSKSIVNWQPKQPLTKSILVKGTVLNLVLRSFLEKPTVDLCAAFGFGKDDQPQEEEFDAQLFGINSTEQFLTSKVLDVSKYPPVSQLFETTYQTEVVVNREQIVESLERASVVAQVGRPVKLNLTSDKIEISAGDEAEADIFEIVDVNSSNVAENLTVHFNPSYLIDGIRAIREPYLRIQIQDEIKPVEFTGRETPDASDNPKYRYILVPVRFSGA
jgi:DNA polymerase-3 subunit beta